MLSSTLMMFHTRKPINFLRVSCLRTIFFLYFSGVLCRDVCGVYVCLPAVLRVGYSDYCHTRYIGQHTKISKPFDKHQSFESFFIPHPSTFAHAPPAFTHCSNPRNVCYHIELVDGKFLPCSIHFPQGCIVRKQQF
jgi:hypothetical protein